MTALMLATINGANAVVAQLIGAGANVDATDDEVRLVDTMHRWLVRPLASRANAVRPRTRAGPDGAHVCG